MTSSHHRDQGLDRGKDEKPSQNDQPEPGRGRTQVVRKGLSQLQVISVHGGAQELTAEQWPETKPQGLKTPREAREEHQ